MLEPVKVTSLKQTLYQAPSEVCTSQHLTPSDIPILHQVIRGFLGEERTIPGNIFSYLHGSMSINYDDIKVLTSSDVTSAYDDDTR